jgi:hypothetical protein
MSTNYSRESYDTTSDDFDRARHILLFTFGAAIEAGAIPADLIIEEIEATAAAMRRIIVGWREVPA